MKLALSDSLLKKMLIGMTIINYCLVVTYAFLLVSVFLFESYFIFLISIPAYVLSNSWLLIVGLFGFEGVLIFYYWWKNKQKSAASLSISNVQSSEIISDDILDFDDLNPQELVEFEEESNSEDEDFSALNQPETITIHNNAEVFDESSIDNEVELEFDKLWEEAISHVRNAASNDKKKTGQVVKASSINSSKKNTNRKKTSSLIKNLKGKNNSKKTDIKRKNAIKSEIKAKARDNNSLSLIKPEHREFYNEIAMNNWIFERADDCDKIGIYKPSLNESRFREKEIEYLIDSQVLHKITIPFTTGSFTIYSIYEYEDEKIIKQYLANLCKQKKINFTQRTVSIFNHEDFGLDKKVWRFDFQINKDVFGLIWLNNFLIIDEETNVFSLTFEKKKELKALLATAQIHLTEKEGKAVIITDFTESVELIQNYINNLGLGKAIVLALGESNFEEQFLEIME